MTETAMAAELRRLQEENESLSRTMLKISLGYEKRIEADIAAAYKAGWIAAAKWANREDLISDTDSPAYKAERDASIRTRGEGIPT